MAAGVRDNEVGGGTSPGGCWAGPERSSISVASESGSAPYSAQQRPGRLGGQRGPQQVLGVQVPAAVLGGVLGGALHQLPGGLTEQPPDVDLAWTGARPAEEAGEEFSEGVVAF